MDDEAKPRRGRPRKTDAVKPTVDEMEWIVGMVRQRLEHQLKREAAIGTSSPNRLPQKGETHKPSRILDMEMRDRLVRLLDDMEDDIAPSDDALSHVAAALHPEAPDIVPQLSSDEITARFASRRMVEAREFEVGALAASLVKMNDRLHRRISELKRLLSGHYGVEKARGRNAARRGRELAAELIGYARGVSGGLPYGGDRAFEGKGSIQDVIQTVWRDAKVPSDPAALAVYRQIPITLSAIEGLSEECNDDPNLCARRKEGWRLGRRHRKGSVFDRKQICD